jgi:hypothetical protein
MAVGFCARFAAERQTECLDESGRVREHDRRLITWGTIRSTRTVRARQRRCQLWPHARGVEMKGVIGGRHLGTPAFLRLVCNIYFARQTKKWHAWYVQVYEILVFEKCEKRRNDIIALRVNIKSRAHPKLYPRSSPPKD